MSSQNWKPDLYYTEGQFVRYQESMWRCTRSHKSSNEFKKTHWNKIKIGHIPKERVQVTNRKYEAITSMNNVYYNKTGRPFLKSFSKHFSHICDIHVYNEGLFEPKAKNMVTEGWDLGPEFIKFQKRHNNDRVKTFSKKGFSIIHAMNNIDCDRLVWLDADTLFVEDFNTQLLDMIAPDDVLSTHFSVWHQHNDITYHSCETGFFILNKKHKGFNEFKDTYSQIYSKDKTDGLRRFYDGEVYGKTVELMAARGHKMMNLNPGKHKTPFSRSVIGPYIQHFKAGLKDRINFDGLEAELETDD